MSCSTHGSTVSVDSGRIRVLNTADSSQLRSAQACTSVAHALEELVLNALDAQATEVHAVLDVPGFSMTVRDNGTGMSVNELALVGDCHATSKLTSVEDLQELVSFGYRGQALAALAAASLLEIVSRRPGTPPEAPFAPPGSVSVKRLWRLSRSSLRDGGLLGAWLAFCVFSLPCRLRRAAGQNLQAGRTLSIVRHECSAISEEVSSSTNPQRGAWRSTARVHPSHIRKIVPPTSVITVEARKKYPGSITTPPVLPLAPSRPTATP